MTVRLNWPPEVVDRLTEEAGRDTARFDEAARLEAREAARCSIRELRKGNFLGPDLTIRDLIDEGRRS